MALNGVRIRRDQLYKIFPNDDDAIRQIELLLEIADELNNVGVSASSVNLDTSGFSGLLDSLDTTAQEAFDTLDGIVGGSNQQIQYNNNSEFSGAPMTYDGSKFDLLALLKFYALRDNVLTVSTSTTLTHTKTHVLQTAAGITTTLWSSPTSGDKITIRHRSSGASSTYNTISGNGANIEGESSIRLYNGESADLVFDSVGWTV